MAHLWIALPLGWKLEDVQAAVTVIINVLSFLAAFTFVRLCWQGAARQVAKNRSVPLHSLLTINVPGEALDVLLLLKRRLFSLRYINICAQSLVIIIVWALTIFAGPIARYSTRSDIYPEQVPGFLGTGFASGIVSDTVALNSIMDKLNNAGFPRDQLLDYLPDNSVDWSFDDKQWNNSWPLDCQLTPETLINLEVNGTCTENQDIVFGFEQAVNHSRWDTNKIHDVFSYWNDVVHDPSKIKDVLYFSHGGQTRWYTNETGTFPWVNIYVLAAYLQGVPTIERNGTGCRFGKGAIDHSSYIKVECDLIVSNNTLNSEYGARPQWAYIEDVVQAYLDYYEARFHKESATNRSITKVQPEELIRFYQAIQADISTYDQIPVTRTISVKLAVTQLSIIFLTIALLAVTLIVGGLSYHGLFAFRHKHVMSGTPLSKVDWMLQSIEAEDVASVGHQDRSRWSVVVDPPISREGMKSGKRRSKEFQAAMYGNHTTSAALLTKSISNTSSRRRSGSEEPNSHVYPGADQAMIRNDQASSWNESMGTDDVRLDRLK